jgi:hypothetical protein
MNATPHSLAGFGSMLATKAIVGNETFGSITLELPILLNNPFVIPFYYWFIIGFPLGFVTHLLLDYINESGLTKKEDLKFDIIPSVICYAIAFFTGNFGIFFSGSISGNLPDLIDKKLYLTIFFPNKFKSTRYLHRQKIILNPKPLVTKAIGIVSCIIVITLLFLITS